MIKFAVILNIMSSELRYDYTYEQFVQNELPSLDLFDLPSFDLFDDSAVTLPDARPFYNLQEESQVVMQQDRLDSFFNDLDTRGHHQQLNIAFDATGSFESDTFATLQPSDLGAFTPLDPAATFKGAEELGVENLCGRHGELQMFDGPTYQSLLVGSETPQASLMDNCGIPPTGQASLVTPNLNDNAPPSAYLDAT